MDGLKQLIGIVDRGLGRLILRIFPLGWEKGISKATVYDINRHYFAGQETGLVVRHIAELPDGSGYIGFGNYVDHSFADTSAGNVFVSYGPDGKYISHFSPLDKKELRELRQSRSKKARANT